MAWTTPKQDFANGDVLTAAQMNAIGGDLQYLYDVDPNAVITSKGDLIAGNSGGDAARLGVGTNGQVLQADSTASLGVKWGTVSASSAMTQIATGSLPAAAFLDITGLSSYDTLFLRIYQLTYGTANDTLTIRVNNNATNVYWYVVSQGSTADYFNVASSFGLGYSTGDRTNNANLYTATLMNCKEAGVTRITSESKFRTAAAVDVTNVSTGLYNVAEAVSSIRIRTDNGYNFSGGTYTLWGA